MAHFPRKRFGQNFLCDPFVIDQIISAIRPNASDELVEIGPGLGSLTKPMLQLHSSLTAIEIDRDLIPILHKQLDPIGNLTIIEADALTVDFKQIASTISATSSQPLDCRRDACNEAEGSMAKRLRVFGNLPYNISTPLIFHLLAQAAVIQDMHFMLQKEVVDRIIAEPGTRDYGRLSIMVQYYCQPVWLFDISPDAFDPPPKVNSSFLRLVPHSQLPYPANDVSTFEKVVKLAFTHRRKTLKNNLTPLLSPQALCDLGIDPTMRPEQIPLECYVKISNYLYK